MAYDLTDIGIILSGHYFDSTSLDSFNLIESG